MHKCIPQNYWDALEEFFGSLDNKANMHTSAFKGGEYGLHAFLTFVLFPILDTMDISHVFYSTLTDILMTFCKAANKKLKNILARLHPSYATCK